MLRRRGRWAYKAMMVIFDLPDERATERLATRLAGVARPDDVIALQGELGAGKTCFARAFIRARGGGEAVPSPTFTLVQTYELPSGAIWHFDLYRLRSPDEAWELGIEDAFHTAALSLIEWPERLGPLLPARHLLVALDFAASPGTRRAALSGGGDWTARLAGIAEEV
jgi:tRNA threonylcarbamoyladenosine biosynthesis protein TsaE